MPSPFPGMDPYLEDPNIWPDLHEGLATQIRTDLNAVLPAPYYARLEMRPELGIVQDGPHQRRIVPDISVVRNPRPPRETGTVAVLERPRTELSPSFDLTISGEPIRHQFVEVRDPSRGHRLVTLIEIVSPSNKRPGPDREAYLQKQGELLTSDASLVEVDLHRSGQRLVSHPEVADHLWRLAPPGHYVVVVSRAWRRVGGGDLQVFPVAVADPLPVIPIPLREGQPEVTLDLQYSFNRAYEGGPYRKGAVDYTQPPRPPLDEELAAWARERLRAAGLVGE